MKEKGEQNHTHSNAQTDRPTHTHSTEEPIKADDCC